jgi:methyl-accepting chemotaxis protein
MKTIGPNVRLTRFFLGKYELESAASRKRAESLLYTLLAMALATALAGVLMVNPIYTGILLGVASVSIALTLLVKTGKADAASATTTFLLSIAFAALPFLETFTVGYELFLITALQGLVLMITGVIARSAWQSMGVMAISITALVLDFFSRVRPATQGTNLDDFVICLLIIVISASIGRVIMGRNAKLLAASEQDAAKSKERLERLSSALESSKGSLSLGVEVRDSTERTRSLIDELRASTLAAKARVEALAASTKAIAESQSEIAASSGEVGENVSEQTAIVTESSAAIEEMTASIGSISSVTGSRRDSIRKLKERTEVGVSEMARSAQAVKAMESASVSILDVVNVIRSVASRTNLLAMNAAIEAAHAGESGKGFSVVADEIRKLSEATGSNVKLISTSIKGTIDSVRTAMEINDRAQEIFGQIDAEVDDVASSIEEIIRGLDEIAAGTDEILKGVSESVSITTKVKAASASVDERIRLVAKDVVVLDEAASSVEGELSAIVSGLDSILAEAGAMSEAGKANEAGLRSLAEELAKLG